MARPLEKEMTTVVVAEKPSVARDIARVLGAQNKGQGCLIGQGYIVTWALGHLVQFAEPDEYGPPWNGRWAFDQLPMLPEKWKLRTSKSTASQFQILKNLLNDANTSDIICATDAGREGENIFRLIYEHARCKKPFQRLWISSLTDEAIRSGFAQLKAGSEFDPLGSAARMRAQADWLVGMNLTRAYTVHNNVLCTIGRVQTPTLAMIVYRDRDIAAFTKAYFYELVAQLNEGFTAKYTRDSQTRIERKEEAERLHRELSPHKEGKVISVEKKVKKNRPPPFYDLNNLQRDANRRFGFTAAQALEYAQALYETHKLITYPRTESRHISEDMVPQLPGILSKLEHPQAADALARLQAGHKLSKAYVDKTKLTDHHAIIPTGQRPTPNLSPALRKVYDLVATRFVGVFLPDQVVEETVVLLDIGGSTFISRGSVVLEEGWKIVERRKGKNDEKASNNDDKEGDKSEDNEEDDTQAIPPLEKGQVVHIDALNVVEKETKPPRPYTDATLLTAMKNAGRQVDDDELAAALKESGLGTPATRADTIERLIRSGYIVREKKAVRASEKGHGLIGLVAEPLRSPELTGAWEQQLKEVEEGKRPSAEFYDAITEFVREIVPQVAEGQALTPEQVAQAREAQGGGKKGKGGSKGVSLGKCPKCKEGDVRESPKAFGCSRYREGCNLTIWKKTASKAITPKQAKDLLTDGHTAWLKGFKSKAGKPFEARLKFDDEFKVVFDFENGPQKKESSGAESPVRKRATPSRESAPAPYAASTSSAPPRDDAPPPSMEQPPPLMEAPPMEGYTTSYNSSGNSAPPAENSPPEPTTQSASAPSESDSSTGEIFPEIPCPKCGQGQIVEGKKGFGCNRFREGCKLVVWKEVAKKTLTHQQVEMLITKGKTDVIKGFISRKGSTFETKLKFDDEWKTVFDFN
ncbi:MAG: DNA topoisomerase-3 [Candidatus Latescibacterota bacterium]